MRRRQKGAAAVEFALVLPILLILVLGILEFGYLFLLHSSAAGAAREGARDMAIHNNQSAASAIAANYFTEATGETAAVSVSPPSCTAGDRVVVTVTLGSAALTGFFGPLKVVGSGEMRCGG